MNRNDPNNLSPQLRSSTVNDARLEAALVHAPEPQIPADFAARVAARAAALPERHRARFTQFGPALTWAALILLPVALFALAPHAAPRLTNYRFDAELVLLAELAAIGYGITRGVGLQLFR